MIVERNEWHVRVYEWWYQHKYRNSAPRYQSNLCPYMRAVMFWAPLRVLFWDWVELFKIKNFKVTLNMLTIPALLYGLPPLAGYFSYKLKFFLWLVALAFTVIFVLICFVAWIINGVEERRNKNKADPAYWEAQRLHNKKRDARIDRWERFFKMIGEYLQSAHDRVCPEVQIVDPPATVVPPPQNLGVRPR